MSPFQQHSMLCCQVLLLAALGHVEAAAASYLFWGTFNLVFRYVSILPPCPIRFPLCEWNLVKPSEIEHRSLQYFFVPPVFMHPPFGRPGIAACSCARFATQTEFCFLPGAAFGWYAHDRRHRVWAGRRAWGNFWITESWMNSLQ